MRKTQEIISWVVYRMSLRKNPFGGVAICEQSEWDEMERGNPGSNTMIQAGITIEAVAERLARSQPGVTPAPTVPIKAR